MGATNQNFEFVSRPGKVNTEHSGDHILRVNVVFTDIGRTAAALKHAVQLARGLSALTRVIVPHVVPYPLSLECPDVPLEFTCNSLSSLVEAYASDAYIRVYSCRDDIVMLRRVLPSGSLVVVGAKNRWPLPTHSMKIARALKKQGCAVIVLE